MLSDYVISTRRVLLPPDQSGREITVSVRGFTFEMVAGLINSGLREEINDAVETVSPFLENPELSTGLDMQTLMQQLLPRVPRLLGYVVALAADEKDPGKAAQVFSTLPMPVQMGLLMAVGELTFFGEHSVKKFIASLVVLIQGSTSLMDELTLARVGPMIGTSNSDGLSRSSEQRE